MDRKQLKEKAKELTFSNLWTIWKPLVIVLLVEAVGELLSGFLFGEDLFMVMMIFNFTLPILLMPAIIGCFKYELDFVRGQTPTLDSLTEYYSNKAVLILMGIIWVVFIVAELIFETGVMSVFTTLSFLFYYTMIPFLFADNPTISFGSYLKRFGRMMNGYKLDYLIYLLSFIGWLLLTLLIVPIIIVLPYIFIGQALYFDEVIKKFNGE